MCLGEDTEASYLDSQGVVLCCSVPGTITVSYALLHLSVGEKAVSIRRESCSIVTHLPGKDHKFHSAVQLAAVQCGFWQRCSVISIS